MHKILACLLLQVQVQGSSTMILRAGRCAAAVVVVRQIPEDTSYDY